MNPQKRKFLQTVPKVVLASVALVVILALGGVSYYFYSKYQETRKQLSAPTVVSNEASRQIIASIGKLMELPMDEEPTVATIANVERLKGQTFFLKAKNGDTVLIYEKAGKAILYRPSIHKIIDVSPITISSQATGSADVAGAAVSPTDKPESIASPTPLAEEYEASVSSLFSQ